ncbi:MAG: hypothetical protein HY306_08290 [Nitrosomonadales bacterium]|nr:hypothetical protein [Nitrosomonadales bacterium]
MIDGNEQVVADEEQLARFILFSKWVRNSDRTVKSDAFIPHPYPDLSVTRHQNLAEDELWKVGQDVADARPVTLYGRADIAAIAVRRQSLKIELAPVQNNLNHANVVGWPTDKPAQKVIALELAANSVYRAKP